MVAQMREMGAPTYQIDIIEAIKKTGKDVLGLANAIAEPSDWKHKNRHITLEEILSSFPSLERALSAQQFTQEQLLQGLGNVHFCHDNCGFVSATCLLPESVNIDPVSDCPVPIPYGNRILIAAMDTHPITQTQEEKERQVTGDSAVWNRLATYLRLGQPGDKAFTQEEFIALARRGNVPIVPFSVAQNAFDFWVKNPMIPTQDGLGFCGKISVQAAAVIQGPSDPPRNHPPRTVVAFDVSRTLSRNSLELFKGMTHAIGESVAQGYLRDQSHLRKPVNGGRMNGQ